MVVMQLDPHSDTLAAIRLGLLALLTVGLLGTGAELLLMGHVDGVSQLVPVALLPVAVLVVGWHVAERGRRSVRTLQATMLAFLASGALGVVLHYRGNVPPLHPLRAQHLDRDARPRGDAAQDRARHRLPAP